MTAARFLACGVVVALMGCSDSRPGPTVVEPPGSPTAPPGVRAEPGFGDGPVAGFLSLEPTDEAGAWTYRIDLDEDGLPDQEGELARPISFAYRFVEPGVHLLFVILRGPGGEREEIRVPVIVNDPSAVRLVRETTVEPAAADGTGTFEGVAVHPDGRFLYLGEFRGDAIHRLDASTLEVVGVLADLGVRGIEGLSVTPSGRFLVANFKRSGLLVVDPSTMVVQARFFERALGGEFYVEAIDDRRALLGRGPLHLVDFVAGESIRRYVPPDEEFFGTRHFAVSPDGETLAAASEQDPTIDVVRLPGLERERTLALPGAEPAMRVASDATGRKLYVLVGRRRGLDRFVALEVESGDVLADVLLDASCGGFCVANPTARSLDGRYVAFETSAGVLFVDTVTNLPMYRSPEQGSVAASPVDDTFFALSPSGRVRVLEVVP